MSNPNLLNWLLSNQPQSQNTAMPQINPTQFKQFVPKITTDNLKQLVIQARQQGMPEEQIQEGLEFIMNMK